MNGTEILALVALALFVAGGCWLIRWLGRLDPLLTRVRRHLAVTRDDNARLVKRRLEVEADRDHLEGLVRDQAERFVQVVRQRDQAEAEQDRLKEMVREQYKRIRELKLAAAAEGG